MSAVLADAGFLALTGRGYGLRDVPRGDVGRSGGVRGVVLTNILAKKPSGPSSDTETRKYWAAGRWSETKPATLTTSEGGLSARTLFGLRPDVWDYMRDNMK